MRDRSRTLFAAGAPALLIAGVSFLHTEVWHGSWDRLNAIYCLWTPERSNVNDALPALDAARTLLATPGGLIYDMSQTDRAAFLYPPIAAALYAPHLGEGENALSSLVEFNRFVYLLVGLLLAAALVGPRRRWPRWYEALGVAAAMALFLPMVRSLELNQASLYVAGLIGAAWVALDRDAEVLAGIFLAGAAVLKPHLFAIAPLLFFHARRAALAAGAAFVALGVASILYAGVENHVVYLTRVLPAAARGYAFFPNQSIGGFLHRLFSDAPLGAFELMPPDRLVMGVTLAVGALLYAATFLVVLRARGRPELRREVFALGWLVTTMSAPIAWGHHYAAALFPLAWLVGRAQGGEERSAGRLTAVATGCALFGSYFVVDGLQGRGPRLLASYGLFGALIAAAAFARSLVRPSSERAPHSEALLLRAHERSEP